MAGERHHLTARGTACGLGGDASANVEVTTTMRPEAQDRLVSCPACRRVLGLEAPSPDPAALWALVRRWRELGKWRHARADARRHHQAPNTEKRGLTIAADELAALLPPEKP